jgi:hypothetical protein
MSNTFRDHCNRWTVPYFYADSRTWTLEKAAKILAEVAAATPDLDRNGLYAGLQSSRCPLSDYDAPGFVVALRFTEETIIPHLARTSQRAFGVVATRELETVVNFTIDNEFGSRCIFFTHALLIAAFIYCRVPFKPCRAYNDATVRVTKSFFRQPHECEPRRISGGISTYGADFEAWCDAREEMLRHV